MTIEKLNKKIEQGKKLNRDEKAIKQKLDQGNFIPDKPLTRQVQPQSGVFEEYTEAKRDYTGMGIFNPPLETEQGNFNLVGMKDGAVQIGIKADDGSLYAGQGAVKIDEDGITIKVVVGNGKNESYKISDANGNIIALFISGIDSVTGENTTFITSTKPTGKDTSINLNISNATGSNIHTFSLLTYLNVADAYGYQTYAQNEADYTIFQGDVNINGNLIVQGNIYHTGSIIKI